MKLFRMLIRSIRDAFKSVIRNFSLSLASISCITITLIIVSIAIMASLNVQNFTKEIERDLTIVAFLDSDTTDRETDKIEKKIKNIKNVDKYEFLSKEDVKEQMKKESDVLYKVLDTFDEEQTPLKATFQIKVKKAEKIKNTAEQIKKMDHIYEVSYGEGMVDQLVSAFASIQKITYVAVIALVLVTVFLIINTIKLTISSRKKEIGIMRLVGASNFTVKTPFIIEGMVLGALGSIIPIIFTTYGYLAFYKHFKGQIYTPLIKLIKPEPFIYNISIIVLIIGILVGMLGSASAVKRYLKI